jgi:hypothetical protein
MNYLTHRLALLGLALWLAACASPNAADATANRTKPNAQAKAQPDSKAQPAAKSSPLAKVAPDPSAQPEAKAVAASPVVKPEQLLAEGVALYDNGDFKGAIRKLQLAKDAAADEAATLQDSLKYLAFSYCVTGQKALCKAQFASLLKISPDFQLSRAEAGHPLWGPVFKETKSGIKPARTTTASAGK